MSLEVGGRSDKYGNEYENKYLVRLLLRVVSGCLKCVVVEPLGEDKDSIEFIATDKNNINWYYQCKSSNTAHEHWTIYDLSLHDVFNRSKNIIQRNSNNRYMFVSPLNYGELPELCKRTRTNSSLNDFLNYQLNNEKIRNVLNDCAKYYNFDLNDNSQCSELIDILSKCYFETSPNGIENTTDLNERVGMYFTGNANAACCVLQNFVNSSGIYGVEITANQILSVMNQNGFYMRNNLYSDNILIKINELNNLFFNAFQPIKGKLIHRSETEDIINSIKSGKSIVLHGKAGTGKSGCVQEVIEELKKDNTLFLAIKLDKMIPCISADNYGKELGLQQSPVYCLHNLSAGKSCVLILDQLDSLRWTNQHSTSALDICKEFISQANFLNKNDNGKISIIFVCRTFDLENDAGLRFLFSEKETETISWNKIQISTLAHEDVEQIVGSNLSGFSLKLKNLLQIPSSLYIWTLLENHASAQFFTTPFQLTESWWKQIQNNCKMLGFDIERITKVKNLTVEQMESSSTLALPEQFFSDYDTELQALISNGLLIKNGSKISFTHQSFLDYFAVSDMLKEIYCSGNVLEVIGDLSEQTPNLRYRFLRILQNILDTDEDYFINVSQNILNSDGVRYYFKCTIFEVSGQSENPSHSLLNYMYENFLDEQWHKYVYNTVYFGHKPFVLDLGNRPHFDWLSDEGLNLLRSVNSKIPDFVLSKIKPICFKDRENDIKVYHTLCLDCSDDTPDMFNIRLKLFERNVDFLENFWCVSNLIKSDSQYLISILKLMLILSDRIKKHIYLGEDNNIDLYAKKHYHEIICELLPVICDITQQFHPQWPNYDFSEEYRNWTRDSFDVDIAREIANIVKISMSEFAIKDPEKFINFLNNFNSKKSIVYYEIIACAINNLDREYSDFAISWLCADPINHFFIYTGNQEDYLAITKKLLEKFSPSCSKAEFEIIEKIILKWKEPVKRMLNIYQKRIDVNKEGSWEPVYYSYWGHLQKELLPFLDKTRLSKHSQELISVLNRNEWICAPFYYCGFSCRPAKSVVSPIWHKTERITDKKWLEIISTPNEKMKNHFRSKETDRYFIEANHLEFSSSMSSQAKHEPFRFAKLSLRFPNECFYGYIVNVINSICDYDGNIDKTDFSIVCDVINHYKNHTNENVIMAILRLIEKRSDEIWPNEIIDFVCETATNLTDSDQNNGNSDNITPHGLLMNALNCTVGRAIRTISELLWKHPKLGEHFKYIVEKACKHPNDSIRFSVMFCILPYFGIDRGFSVRKFMELIKSDLRILGFYGAWEIICRDFQANGMFYANHLLKACQSNINELDECAAVLLCASAIFFDEDLKDKIFDMKFNENQVDKICSQAVSSFNLEEYHIKSKEVLMNYIDKEDHEIYSLKRLFYDECIDIDRDEEFLIQLMQSKQSLHLLYVFIDYINEQDKDITKYLKVIKSVCEKILVDNGDMKSQMVLDHLIKCIMMLYNKT